MNNETRTTDAKLMALGLQMLVQRPQDVWNYLGDVGVGSDLAAIRARVQDLLDRTFEIVPS